MYGIVGFDWNLIKNRKWYGIYILVGLSGFCYVLLFIFNVYVLVVLVNFGDFCVIVNGVIYVFFECFCNIVYVVNRLKNIVLEFDILIIDNVFL